MKQSAENFKTLSVAVPKLSWGRNENLWKFHVLRHRAFKDEISTEVYANPFVESAKSR